jgi:hypothetical protein
VIDVKSNLKLGVCTRWGGANFCPFCPHLAPLRVDDFQLANRTKKRQSVHSRAGQVYTQSTISSRSKDQLQMKIQYKLYIYTNIVHEIERAYNTCKCKPEENGEVKIEEG